MNFEGSAKIFTRSRTKKFLIGRADFNPAHGAREDRRPNGRVISRRLHTCSELLRALQKPHILRRFKPMFVHACVASFARLNAPPLIRHTFRKPHAAS
ncbi:protein of unknown function [Paraburkholderia dioscoreae]|uniref:Uncharacterized protein n=1 Tax=Paraburkholderia dioscoreae TaxID=2604047 RepID=A0A5Q4ZLP2_9BURK|nr:protein of unknown function [Paraburkholderia dioscoreae]